MECEVVRLLLNLRPGQQDAWTARDEAVLDRHLAGCTDCRHLAQALQHEHEVLSRAMSDVPIPPDLHGKLLQTVAAAERGYRRRRLLWSGAVVALAASLIWGVMVLRPGPATPPVDLQFVQQWARLRWLPTTPATPADALRFIREAIGTSIPLPPDLYHRWEFGHLTAVYFEFFGSHCVPVMEFRNQNSHALVLLLRADQFDPDQLASFDSRDDRRSGVLQPAPGDHYTALVLMRQGSALDLLK
ncbi:MAG TPA: hypothetical protein PKD86_00770 [Gemmatales bacterium]|nr:hypothetical protein [Gemmatales bacterium]HMP57856.1 hypothetical protein [Gemmatales bacterium]